VCPQGSTDVADHADGGRGEAQATAEHVEHVVDHDVVDLLHHVDQHHLDDHHVDDHDVDHPATVGRRLGPERTVGELHRVPG